jgi:hypothetical protein
LGYFIPRWSLRTHFEEKRVGPHFGWCFFTVSIRSPWSVARNYLYMGEKKCSKIQFKFSACTKWVSWRSE